MIYLNDRHAEFNSSVPLGEAMNTTSIAVGDVDGDGAIDILQGNLSYGTAPYYVSQSSRLYRNTLFDRTGMPNNPSLITVLRPVRTGNANLFSTPDILRSIVIPITHTLFDLEGDPVGSLRAFYSPDGGGKWYTATAASGMSTTSLPTAYFNTTPLPLPVGVAAITSTLIISSPGYIGDLDVIFNMTHTYDSDVVATLVPPSGQSVRLISSRGGSGDGFFNTVFDDEAGTPIISGTAPFTGHFRPEQPLSVLDNQAISGTWKLLIRDMFPPADGGRLNSWALHFKPIYTYNWDTFASGFFGQSDNVVFRMEAYPSLSSGPNGVPVFQHPYASATTFPFRVRGTQVQVVTPTITSTKPISNAIVYPKDQHFGAEVIADNAGNPFHTDGQGYLQGRGRLDISDTLVALAPVFTQWRNGSLLFDGVNDYVNLGNPTSMNISGTVTLEAWVNISATQDFQDIIAHGYITSTAQAVFLQINNGSYQIGSWNGANHLASYAIPPGDINRWVHLAGVYDGSTWRLYHDGIQVNSVTDATGAVAVNDNWAIGARGSGTERFLGGLIDDVRLWNVARTQSQIQADMDRVLNGNEAGLVGYWRFDEGTGSLAHDQTTNHNDGVINGATWSGGGEQYTVYHTSAAPNSTGLSMTPVISPGVQVLTVTASNPLILFNLDVSLEWDARQDQQFLAQLEHDLHTASDALYDWTNGQVALGKVNVYFDRDHWDEADVQIYATNRLRPNATQGGIVGDSLVDPITATGVITYEPGQISMGVVWNRYGEANGNLGEDWPKALAHEIGHYALFLDDDYLGLNANRQLIPIDTCTKTAMSDPYRADYSEFHFAERWSDDCASTLAAQQVGRWDWATITTFYPWLNGTHTNDGPTGLPLAVTQVDFIEPLTETTVLPAPIFNLTEGGAKTQPGSSARTILYQQDGRLIDLGSPTLDQVNARGARVGDRLCVYDVSEQRLGCETITAGDEELALVSKPDWTPDILISPVNSRTLNLEVSVAGVSPARLLKARLYPIDGPASSTITLTRQIPHRVYLPLLLRGSTPSSVVLQAETGTTSAAAFPERYVGAFALDEPAPQGYVQIWVDEPEPRRESVVDYALGGNPAYRHGTGAYRHGTGAYRHGTGAYRHGTGAYRHGTGAPTQSADGQVQIFGDGLVFNPGEFFALQAVNGLPFQPAGTTLVGQGYRLLASAGAPSLLGTSISFYYAGRDVPPGEEAFLSVYFWNGARWQKLPTTLNTDYNVAVAPTQGAGLYALLSSIEIPLYGPGWNPIIYPAQGSKLVAEALASINDSYGIVYGTVLTETADPWKVYAVNVPMWVNDLATLDFGKTYWISVTQAITLQVTGNGAARPSNVENLPSPPMTVYGTAAVSGTVTAWINGVQCGQGQTQMDNGQIVYTLNIQPDAPGGKLGCGAAGRSVTFKVGSQTMRTTIGWDIDRVRNAPLTP